MSIQTSWEKSTCVCQNCHIKFQFHRLQLYDFNRIVPYLWPIIKRITIPFSRSNCSSFSPGQRIQAFSTSSSIELIDLIYTRKNNRSMVPWGIQVSLTESRLFLLLKAVLIPITINAFFLVGLSLDNCELPPAPLEVPISWELRAAANSIWIDAICLSRELASLRKIHNK